MLKTTAYMVLRSLGWLLAVAGLIMPGLLIYDELTTRTARATIVEIDHVCEKRVCLIGRCNWQRISCTSLDSLAAAGEDVRRKPRVKVEFDTERGRAAAWAHNTKLNLGQPKIGDEIDMLYRGPSPFYVTAPFSHRDAGLGLLISLLGGLVLIATARWRFAEV